MNEAKRRALEEAGFQITTVDQFLGLSNQETALIDMRLALSAALRQRRQEALLSQGALAERIHSSQSRIAKAEAGDPSISMDLLIRALLATGADRNDLSNIIARDPATFSIAMDLEPSETRSVGTRIRTRRHLGERSAASGRRHVLTSTH